MTDLDIGMNQRLCEPLAWDDARALRPRQGDEPPRSSRRARTSAATSTSTATASRTAPCPGTHPTRAPTSPAARRATRYARYSEAGPDYVYNMQRLLQKFETAKALVPQPLLRTASARDALRRRSTTARPARRWTRRSTRSQARRHPRRRAARARVPVQRRGRPNSSPRTTTVFVIEQNRDAQLRMLLVNEQRDRPRAPRAGAALRRHADHRALHHRRDRQRACAPTTSSRSTAEGPEARMTYLAKPKLHHPTLPSQRARLHAARLRRQDLDPVRRLRPRLDLRRASSRPAGSSTSSRTASPSSRASAARRRRPTISSAPRTASTPCTAACPRC